MSAFSSEVNITRSIYSVITLAIALVISIGVKKLIDLIFLGVKSKVANQHILAKTRTIRSLLKNIIDAIILVIVLLMVLSHWGFDIFPILTGAGILGLAISFGSQTLIKDVINGFFIIAEDQFNVGDWVKIDKFEGEVYKITLRLTILRDENENLIYIPNSQISTVTKLKEK